MDSVKGLENSHSPFYTLLIRKGCPGLVSDGSMVWHTGQNIKNWEPSSGILKTDKAQATIFGVDNKVIYFSRNFGQSVSLYKSTNGGFSFELKSTLPTGSVRFCDIHFVDENTGYITMGNKILKTIDGGLNWTTEVALGDSAFIFELDFVDAKHGWACTVEDGSVLIFKK